MPGQFPPPPESGPPPPYFAQGFGGGRGYFPLDIGRTFSLAWSMFRFRFWKFAAIGLAVMLPVALLVALAGLWTADASLTLAFQLQSTMSGGLPEIPASLWPLLGLSLLVSVLSGIGSQLAQVGVTRAASETYGGGQTRVGASIRFAFQRFVTLLAVGLITFAATVAIIGIGAVVATVVLLAMGSSGRLLPGPGVFLWLLIFVATFAMLLFVSVRWAVVIPVIVVERLGAIESLRRSWRLVSGSSWRVLGYLLAFLVAVGLLSLIVTLPASVIVTFASFNSTRTLSSLTDPTWTAALSFVTTLVSVVLAPLVSIGMMLLYFDLRFRQGENVPQPGRAVDPEARPPGPQPLGPLPPGPPTF